MAAKAPKQWKLTTEETITSFQNWRQNLQYTLLLDSNFSPFLEDGVTWEKKTNANPKRGFIDDGQPIAAEKRKTAVQKVATLELMLGQISNYCPVLSQNSIVKNSTSLSDIWQKIREHYGFHTTGARILDLADFSLKAGERPQDLFQRLTAFFEDNLLTKSGNITHHGAAVVEDEDLTPTLENAIVVLWLQLIHPSLPQLVKQKYGSELRNRSIASIKSEISQALQSLLDEVQSHEDTKVLRTGARFRPQASQSRHPYKSCFRCGKRSNYECKCKYLPDNEKHGFRSSRPSYGQSRLTQDDDLEEVEPEHHDDTDNALLDPPNLQALRVNVVQSPFLMVYFDNHPIKLTLDTGATTNIGKTHWLTHCQSITACQASGWHNTP
jgi:hypothetical protein